MLFLCGGSAVCGGGIVELRGFRRQLPYTLLGVGFSFLQNVLAFGIGRPQHFLGAFCGLAFHPLQIIFLHLFLVLLLQGGGLHGVQLVQTGFPPAHEDGTPFFCAVGIHSVPSLPAAWLVPEA